MYDVQAAQLSRPKRHQFIYLIGSHYKILNLSSCVDAIESYSLDLSYLLELNCGKSYQQLSNTLPL